MQTHSRLAALFMLVALLRESQARLWGVTYDPVSRSSNYCLTEQEVDLDLRRLVRYEASSLTASSLS